MTDRDQAQLHEVATFDHQVTGVSVSKNGRIFVNFPRWTEDAPVSVAELAAKVERVGVNGVADGLLMDEKDRMGRSISRPRTSRTCPGSTPRTASRSGRSSGTSP